MMRLAPLPAPPCGHPAIPGTIACATCEAPEDWREHAVCRQVDPEMFFPKPGSGASEVKAVIQICGRCPVRPYCLEEGWTEHYGIWGGWTVLARRKERRKNRSTVEIRALSVRGREE